MTHKVLISSVQILDLNQQLVQFQINSLSLKSSALQVWNWIFCGWKWKKQNKYQRGIWFSSILYVTFSTYQHLISFDLWIWLEMWKILAKRSWGGRGAQMHSGTLGLSWARNWKYVDLINVGKWYKHIWILKICLYHFPTLIKSTIW